MGRSAWFAVPVAALAACGQALGIDGFVDSDGAAHSASAGAGGSSTTHSSSVGSGCAADCAVPRFAYVASFNDGTVDVFAIDAASGQLHGRGYGIAHAAATVPVYPLSVTVDRLGQHVYSANFGSGTVTSFAIDPASGAMREPNTVVIGGMPTSIAVHPKGAVALVASFAEGDTVPPVKPGTLGCYLVDPDYGALVAFSPGATAPTGPGPRSLAFHPAGKVAYAALYGASKVATYRVEVPSNAASCTLTPLGEVAAGTQPIEIAADPLGRFVLSADQKSDDVSFFRVEPSGALSAGPKHALPGGTSPFGVAIAPNGKFAYVGGGNGTVSALGIDPDSGALSDDGVPQSTGSSTSEVAVDPSGKFLYATSYVANTIAMFAIGGDGKLTPLGSVGAYGSPYAVAIAPGAQPLSAAPRFALVADAASNDVSSYTIDPASGALSPAKAGPRPVGIGPTSLALHPGGKYALSANLGGNDLWLLDIGPEDGAVAKSTTLAAGENGAPAWKDPAAVAIEPTGRFAYLASKTSNDLAGITLAVDAGAALASFGAIPVGNAPAAVAVDPAGKLVFLALGGEGKLSVYHVIPTTGGLELDDSQATPLGASAKPLDVAVHPSGRFAYLVDSGSDDVAMFRVDTDANTGKAKLAPLGTVPAVKSPRAIALDPSGRRAFVACAQSGSVAAFSVDPASGMLTANGTLPVGGSPAAIAAELSGRFAYLADGAGNQVVTLAIGPDGKPTVKGAPVPTGTSPVKIVTTAAIP